MTNVGISTEALQDPKTFYDRRFDAGYMTGFDDDVFEACRVRTIREVLGQLKRQGFEPRDVLDYGCGQGRYIQEVGAIFPDAAITGCDISDAGLQIAARDHPEAVFLPMADERIAASDSSFDLVISVEVLEHVQDVRLSAREIGRVMKPGGMALITTPCANRYSLDWLHMSMKGGLQPSHDGYGRFAIDEPGHLRRLTDAHLRDMFAESGVVFDKIYHRSHLFTPIIEHRRIRRRLSVAQRARLAMIDWRLFKHLPNGATMLAVGRKAPLAS